MIAAAKVLGLDRVVKALDDMEKREHAKAVDVMRAGGLMIKKDAQKELRKGHGVKTGTLRRSITAKTSTDGSKITTEVGSKVHYAPYVEYGWKRGTKAGAKVQGKTSGKRRTAKRSTKGAASFSGYHYLSKAFNANVDKIYQQIRALAKGMRL